MNDKANYSWSNAQLLGLTVLLFAAACVFHLASARAGYPHFRDQHLGTAIEYARTHIDLLKPVIIGFNATQTPTPQELPLWQALVAIAFKTLGPWYGWANLVSLLVLFTALFPLFRLTQDFMGTRCAWWTLVFFLAQPLVFIYAGLAGTDGFSLAAAIWFLFCALKLLRAPGAGWWLATFLIGTISAVSKLPFFLAAGLTCFFFAVKDHRHNLRPWYFLGSAAALITVIFLAWTRYTEHCFAQAEFPLVDLRMAAPGMKFWYFGDWHYRLSPGNWIKGGWRLLNDCFGSFALAGLFLYALFFLKENALAKLSLLTAFLTTLIFSHLVLHHTHYYLMYCPAVAILCAQAAVAVERRLTLQTRFRSWLGLGIVAAVLGLSIVQGLIGMKIVLVYDHYPHDMAKIIRQYTSPSDKLLIEGGGWGGGMLFLSDRQGLSIWNTKLLENPDTLLRLKQLGYDKLVMLSDSPLLVALEKINPGQTELTRETYHSLLTPPASGWPTLFESDDIIIKSIP